MFAVTSVPTWLAAIAIVVPAATALGGYWLAGHNEEERDVRTADRERRQRQDLLAEKLDERRHTFQLELLLDLQDIVRRFARATHKLARFDQNALEKIGKTTLLGEDLDREVYDAGVDLGRLRVRVLDDELRALLATLHNRGTRLELAQFELDELGRQGVIDLLERQTRALGEVAVAVFERVGVLIRAELVRTPEVIAP
jgi:hypothetical protein